MTESGIPRYRGLVSPAGAVMLRAMVDHHKEEHYCDGVAAAIQRPRATIRPLLRRLETVGWLTGRFEPRGRYQARKLYRFTPDGLKAARAELKTWDFID